MNDKDNINTLQEEVEIPVTVKNKIDETLLKIKEEGVQDSKIVVYGDREAKLKKGKRKFSMVAAIAILVITSISVGATVYVNWSKGLEESLHVQEEQKPILKKNKTTTFMEQTSTSQGVTVTAVQSITDNHYTYIAFKVEGFDIEEGEEPFFENTNATVVGEDNDETKSVGVFYDGLTTGPDGKAVYADGTPLLEKDGEFLINYKAEDGSLEFHLTLYNSMEEKGYFINKKVHIELENLGTVKKTEYFNKVAGKWTFDIDLQGSDEVKEAVLDVPLGYTDAIVIGAEISPISIGATYTFPRTEETMELSEDEAREIALASGVEVEDIVSSQRFPLDPPRLMGVKLKDGTIYPYLYMGPGSSGYMEEDSDICYIRFAIDRILDPSQVEALLFEKSYAGVRGVPTEDDFYVVPLG